MVALFGNSTLSLSHTHTLSLCQPSLPSAPLLFLLPLPFALFGPPAPTTTTSSNALLYTTISRQNRLLSAVLPVRGPHCRLIAGISKLHLQGINRAIAEDAFLGLERNPEVQDKSTA